MTTYAIEEQKLANIADAIRGKTGGVDTLSVDEMATEIEGISAGSGVVSWNDLKDKPFGELRNTEDIVKLQIVSGNETILTALRPVTMNVGDVMHVTFDGVEYVTTVYVLRENPTNTMYGIGNGYIRPQPDFEQNYVGTDTMPFLVAHALDKWYCYTQEPNVEHTISIGVKSDPHITTIDPMFLPDIETSWNDLTDKPFGVAGFLQNRVAEYEKSASTKEGVVTTPALGYRGEDRKLYFHDYHAINLYLNGVLYQSGTVQKNDAGYDRIFTSDGVEMTNKDFRLDRTTGLYVATIVIPPLKEDTTVTVTYEYDAEFATIDPNFLPESVKGGLPWLKITCDGENYATNMTYAEAVALLDNKSLLGGCYIDAGGVVFPFVTIEHIAGEEKVVGKFNNWGDDMFIAIYQGGITEPYGLL